MVTLTQQVDGYCVQAAVTCMIIVETSMVLQASAMAAQPRILTVALGKTRAWSLRLVNYNDSLSQTQARHCLIV